eukprot:TRINITY_DN31992_c0_g1_i1.p1 TRINITY_DN31992_c0_g1~~TRINITY_DN31992_c0_g1_i1.p1  ORF type:complete len:651 (-),score=102.49 TRINITY_DN31992_c0_g1_i1:74-1981(-)
MPFAAEHKTLASIGSINSSPEEGEEATVETIRVALVTEIIRLGDQLQYAIQESTARLAGEHAVPRSDLSCGWINTPVKKVGSTYCTDEREPLRPRCVPRSIPPSEPMVRISTPCDGPSVLTLPVAWGASAPRDAAVPVTQLSNVKTDCGQRSDPKAMDIDNGSGNAFELPSSGQTTECSPIGRGRESVSFMLSDDAHFARRNAVRHKAGEMCREEAWGAGITDDAEVLQSRTDIRSRITYFVVSGSIDGLVSFFLFASAIVLGVEADMTAKHVSAEMMKPLALVDLIFTMFFALEIMLRMWVFGRDFIKSDDRAWNIFDAVVVSSSIVAVVTTWGLTDISAQNAMGSFGLLRLLRLCRLLRLIRIVKLIPELESIVYLLAASMSSFLWSATLMVFMMYLLSVYYTEALSLLQSTEELEADWGGIVPSMLSLFQGVTGGVSWKILVNAWEKSDLGVASKIQHTVIFCGFVVFTQLVLLNLVTGVFVDGARRLAASDRKASVLKQALQLYSKADVLGKNAVTFKTLMEDTEPTVLNSTLEALELRVDELEAVFTMFDTDGSGDVSMEEFVQGVMHYRNPAKSLEVGLLNHTAQKLAKDVQKIGREVAECLAEQKRTRDEANAFTSRLLSMPTALEEA